MTRIILGIFTLLLIGSMIGCKEEEALPIPGEYFASAISSIELETWVTEANAAQDGHDVIMVIDVIQTTSENLAKFLGQKYVDLLHERVDGNYNYIIGVYLPGDIPIALGEQNRGKTSVDWASK